MGTWDCGAGNQVSDTGSTEPLVTKHFNFHSILDITQLRSIPT